MTHEELEDLASEYLEGRLSPAHKAAAEDHLKGCASCRELVAEIRHAIHACQAAEEVIPPPWLIPSIRRATTGGARTAASRLSAAFNLLPLRQRFAYAAAMVVFSLSLIVNASGMRLRDLTLQELNPVTWVYRANQAGHLLYARAEKFYYDLQIVYEIEFRFRDVQAQLPRPGKQLERPSLPLQAPTSKIDLEEGEMAFARSIFVVSGAEQAQGVRSYEMR